jgi:hypothetical protein
MLWDAVHARLGAADRRRRLFTLLSGALANTCVHQNWKFKHTTRILDVIMLQYPVKVRPMPGMWIQSMPVTGIPWGRMNMGRHGALLSSIREG